MKIVVSPGSVLSYNSFFGQFMREMEALGNEITSPSLRQVMSVDVLHVHFPEYKVSVNRNILRAVTGAIAMLLYMCVIRLRGKPVVWMVHDVVPMQGFHPHLRRAYMALVRQLISGYIFLSHSSRLEFERRYPGQRNKPMLEVFHPPYTIKPLSNNEKDVIRAKLGVGPDEFLVGYLGEIREYKNPETLSHIPEKLADGRRTTLLIAGKADDKSLDYKKYFATRRHIYLEGRVSDEELGALTQAVDAMLLPYVRVSNSGFLFHVLSCRQKTLTSNLPVFSEMQGHFGDKWITTFDLAAHDQRQAISNALNYMSSISWDEDDAGQLAEQLEEKSFPNMAADIEAFYKKLG